MARSLKKGPYVDEKLLKKVERMNRAGDRRPIKTWARSSMMPPPVSSAAMVWPRIRRCP